MITMNAVRSTGREWKRAYEQLLNRVSRKLGNVDWRGVMRKLVYAAVGFGLGCLLGYVLQLICIWLVSVLGPVWGAVVGFLFVWAAIVAACSAVLRREDYRVYYK